eukprot:gene6761-10926_t
MKTLFLLFTLFLLTYANIPSASCSIASTLGLDLLEIKQGKDGCEDKVVCKLNCQALSAGYTYKNYNFTPFLDLTTFYTQNNVSRNSYDFACLTRVFTVGIADWSDVSSILFRSLVFNYTNNSDTTFFVQNCPAIHQLFPDMKQREPLSLLHQGISFDNISACFNNFDERYWEWATKNLTEDKNQVEIDVMNAILYYKDAFPGFQKLCIEQFSNTNLTGDSLKAKLEILLHKFEQDQLDVGKNQTKQELEHNSMYQYFESYNDLVQNGHNNSIFPIYRKFVDLFVSGSLVVENRRYCGCSNFERLNEFLISDFNQTTTDDSYPSITTKENIQTLTNFTNFMISICNAGYYNYTPPYTSPNPQYSPRISPGLSPSNSPVSSSAPKYSKLPQSSNSPIASNTPSNSPSTSLMSPSYSPTISPQTSNPQTSNKPQTSPNTTSRVSIYPSISIFFILVFLLN